MFGKVLGKEKVFLIQNIFPVTERYIKCKYKNKNKDVEINYSLKIKIIRYAKEIIRITNAKGNVIAFNNIIEMKKTLLNDERINV